MKSIWFHMQGYRDLPDNFGEQYESVWVNPPTDELCDPEMVHKYLNWNLDELQQAADLGFDGIGTNEHHQNGYGFPASPNLTAYHLAKSTKDPAIVVLGNTLPIYQPPIRAAEELAFIDCLSGGRVVAGMPVGTPMDVTHCYGVTPTEVRPRYFEAHDLITQAWTRPGPFTFNGRFTKLRHVNLWPKPIQDPHPPIWLAGGGSPETWEFAAEMDYTYNYLSFNGRKAASGMMGQFWDEMDRLGKDRNPFRAGFAQIVCVAETDAEAERLYLPHLRNFYQKSLHVAPHFGAVAGYNSKRATEATIRKGKAPNAFTGIDPSNLSWSDLVDDSQRVIGGSPATVIDQLTELATDLHVGHLILIMQIQSMDHELTKYNTAMYAEHVMPAVRELWSEDDWPDHWWPSGAKRPTLAATSAER